ncbi:hypothetical protein [Brevibacterium otitidis]|uniref:Uncharacterized protein n=1 Tax=Brevibacterium otitidis TaxID=53364 RepID=A0ABV5X476_9MICO|nr:hypothetical protein GCM10023233_16310 [Brevibacterium otitidis]
MLQLCSESGGGTQLAVKMFGLRPTTKVVLAHVTGTGMMGVMKKSLGLTLAVAALLSLGSVSPAAAVQAKPAPDYPNICWVWKVAQLCSNVKG